MKYKIIAITLLGLMTFCAKVKTNENIFSVKLGDSKVYVLSEGQGSGNAGILIGANPEITEKYTPNDSFPIATNAFLWQVCGKNILFDTGYGKNLFDNLQFLQLKPEDIDAILITHAHGDHIGGLLRNDQAVFPKAELYVSQQEYDYWTNEEVINQMSEGRRNGFLAAQKAFGAYKDKLHLFEPNEANSSYGEVLLPGIKAIAASGHTPGHSVFLLESGKDKLLIWGDLAHAMTVQMPHPEVAVTYDVNPEMAIQSRLTILDFVVNQKIPVAGMHIPYPSIGAIEKATEQGYRFVPEK
jgi:glyoxylase-like metal-dependent hydrolase (beta-lactamase superfamily II)